MWHPWLIVFTVAELALIATIGYAVNDFRKNPNEESDIISIGLVILIFIGVIASMVWIFVLAETLQNGVLK